MPDQNQSDPNQSTDFTSPVISPQGDPPPLTPAFQNLPDNDSNSAAPPDISSIVPKPKKKFGTGRIIATILGLVVLVGGIGAGIILTQQKQLFKQKAATPVDCVISSNPCGNYGCKKWVCPQGDTNDDGKCQTGDTGASVQTYSAANCANLSCGEQCCQIDWLTSSGGTCTDSKNCKEINLSCSSGGGGGTTCGVCYGIGDCRNVDSGGVDCVGRACGVNADCTQQCQVTGTCGGGAYCGDGSCNNGETCGSCPGDCGSCATCTAGPSGNPTISYDTTEYDVYAYGVTNATSVSFTEWVMPGSDGYWTYYAGTNQGGGTWKATVNPALYPPGQIYVAPKINGIADTCPQITFIRISPPTTTASPTPIPTHSPSPTPTKTPTPTATPTPTPIPLAPYCVAVKAYGASWNVLTNAQLSALTTGTTVNFCVAGAAPSGTFDMAQFTINGVQLATTTSKRPGSTDFCQSYTILSIDTTITVTAKIHHSVLGWF
jgi:hypothetical protein